jgi:alpha-mannosidase
VRVELGPEDPSHITVRDSEEELVPARIITKGLNRELTFYATEVPSLGFKHYSLHPTNATSEKDERGHHYSIENEYLKVTLDAETGNISSIYEKKNNREIIEGGKEANVIELHENLPDFWDAWNIGYTGRSWTIDEVDSIELVEDNPIRSVLRVKKSFLGLTKANRAPTEGFPSSFFTQDIILYRGSPQVDVEMAIDWWEDHTVLKVAFPFAVNADVATYEIPYASIERSTKRETEWEKARYEVPVHRWADLSADGYGVSLLNDSKYGMDIHGNVMRLTLLTSPLWPDPLADRGKHRVAYSIYPHSGDWKEANTVRSATELNLPLVGSIIETAFPHPAENAPAGKEAYSFFRIDRENAVLTTWKKAESSDALVARIVETRGISGRVVVEVPWRLDSASEVDLLEDEIDKLRVKGNRVVFDLDPYEIKSLILLPRQKR